MRAYLMTTGVIFALIVAAHLVRLVAENLAPATDPVWVLLTVLAAALAGWAWRLLRRSSPS